MPNNDMTPTLILLAKAPLPGRCNSRLHGRLGPRGAARMQRWLIQDRLRCAAATGYPVELHVTPDLRHPQFLRARRMGLRVRRQRGRDLGPRMRQAQAQRPAVLIGTDCPALGRAGLRSALEQVAQGRAVCIPARDGGYVLLGLPRACPAMFHAIDWGSSRVMAQTRRQLRRLEFPALEPAALADLDTAADYLRERRAGRLPAF